jgi:hypothetical protein
MPPNHHNYDGLLSDSSDPFSDFLFMGEDEEVDDYDTCVDDTYVDYEVDEI